MIRSTLAATLLALSPIPSLAQSPIGVPQITGTRLEISATGAVQRTPDLATIGAGVVTQSSNAAKALADNAARMTATIAAIRRAGVADRDIRSSSIRLEPQYRYADNQPPTITGYQAANQVTVRLRDIDRAGSVLDALVAAGANQLSGPNLTVSEPDAALDEARGKAIAQARARAELYAKAAGLSVKRIVAISEGAVARPYASDAILVTAMRAKAPTPIEPGEQELSVTVQATFELG